MTWTGPKCRTTGCRRMARPGRVRCQECLEKDRLRAHLERGVRAGEYVKLQGGDGLVRYGLPGATS